MPKVSDEDLKALQELQAEYTRLTSGYGELQYQYLLIGSKLSQLQTEMLTLSKQQLDLNLKIRQQFGKTGMVDLKTGEFKPDQ